MNNVTSMGRQVRILQYKFGDSAKWQNQLVEWDHGSKQFDIESKLQQPDMTKVAALIMNTTGKLQAWIQRNGSNIAEDDQLREQLISYATSNTISTSKATTTSPTPSSSDPMDISTVESKSNQGGTKSRKGQKDQKEKGKGKGLQGKCF